MQTDLAEFSPSLFRGFADASPNCVRILSLGGHILHANSRDLALLDVKTLDEVRGRHWGDFWPEHRAHIDGCIAEAVAGRPAALQGRAMVCGVLSAWRSDASPIRDDDGRPIALMIVSRNVSVELDSIDFLRDVLEQLPAAVMIKRVSDGQFVLANKAAEMITGLAPKELLGKTVFDLVPEPLARKLSEDDAALVRSGEVVEQEHLVPTASGERVFVGRQSARINENNEASHIFIMFEDVTDRRATERELAKALEQAEQASRAKSTFLANMSHEIRTPLNGVLAVADLLARGGLDDGQRELVEIIRTSGGTLLTLLSDILDLAKIESGQVEIEAAPFDLAGVLESTAALFRMRAEEKGLVLICAADVGAGAWVSGDAVRVRQILSNLLSNAIKFTERGEIRLSAERAAGADRVRFTVSDTGIGFDQAFKARMFGRFQQADPSITRKFGGTGLGLSICRDLAELMGGGLECDAEPGVGARFWFDLPLPEAQAGPSRPAMTEGAALEGNLRILVADDHPINRRVISLILADIAEIVCVENGAEAVSIAGREPFDLVLMDMQMPVMDGLAAVRAIRAGKGPQAHAPIIMLSANALEEHVAASLAAGANLHLSKPVSADSLLQAISRLLEAEAEVASAA